MIKKAHKRPTQQDFFARALEGVRKLSCILAVIGEYEKLPAFTWSGLSIGPWP
jgi:hypothetical protein